MRPQHITAENVGCVQNASRISSRFNEAAAYHCGKLAAAGVERGGDPAASMRPQHITAENGGRGRAAA